MFTRFLLAASCAALLLSSCATTARRAPLTRSPTILSDSVLAVLDPLLPASVAPATPHFDVPRSPLREFFSRSTAGKDKRQLHVTVYHSPAVVKGGSTVTVGDGNVTADNRKARGPVAVGDSASAADNTKAGQKGGTAATGAGSPATNNTKAGSRGGAAATGTGSTASSSTRKGGGGGVAWWLLLVALGGGWLAGRFRWPV